MVKLQAFMVLPDARRSRRRLCNLMGDDSVADIHVVDIAAGWEVHFHFLTELCASVGVLQRVDDLRHSRESQLCDANIC